MFPSYSLLLTRHGGGGGRKGVEMEEMEEGDHPRGNGGNEADEGEANRPEGWSERRIGTKDGGGAKLFRAP